MKGKVMKITIKGLRAAWMAVAAAALWGCGKEEVKVTRDVGAEVEAFYAAHPDFFTFATPEAIPSAKDPAYQSGESRLGREPSSPNRSLHQARWSRSSAPARSRASLTRTSRATSDCPA